MLSQIYYNIVREILQEKNNVGKGFIPSAERINAFPTMSFRPSLPPRGAVIAGGNRPPLTEARAETGGKTTGFDG